MSYSFEGKVVNQGYSYCRNTCGCCNKLMDKPEQSSIYSDGKYYTVRHYLSYPSYYIYETKGSFAVVYCSDKCRRKHNHRFTKQEINMDYEHSLIRENVRLINYIKSKLRVGDEVVDDSTGATAKIVELRDGKFILDILEVPRNAWEITLKIEK